MARSVCEMLSFCAANCGCLVEHARFLCTALESSTFYRGFLDRGKQGEGASKREGQTAGPAVKHAMDSLFQGGTSLPLFLRRLIFAVMCILIYGLLDRTTVYLQIWPSISAWYPPIGMAVALMVGIGLEMFPVLLIAGFLAGCVNYHQDPTGFPFLLINPLIPLIYGSASLYLRRKLTAGNRIRCTRDVSQSPGRVPVGRHWRPHPAGPPSWSGAAKFPRANMRTRPSIGRLETPWRFPASPPFCWSS